MKNLLFTLALLISFVSYAQEKINNPNVIAYENILKSIIELREDIEVKMNSLGNSIEDYEKYDELAIEMNMLDSEIMRYINKIIEIDESNDFANQIKSDIEKEKKENERIEKLVSEQFKKNREKFLNSNWGDSLMREKIKKTVRDWDFSEEKIKQSIYNSKNPKKPIYFENIRITSKEEYCHTQERITTELNNNPDNINQVLKKNIAGIIGLIKYSRQFYYNNNPKYYQFPTRQEYPFIFHNKSKKIKCDLTFPEMADYLGRVWSPSTFKILKKIADNTFYEDDLTELDYLINKLIIKVATKP